jgi:hypothetical protein
MAESTVEQDIQRAADSQAYMELIGPAVAALQASDGAAFKGMMSKKFVAAIGEETVDAVLANNLFPFFADFAEPGSTMYVTDTEDQFGDSGYAFYTSIKTTGGDEKPFVVYVVSEDGQPVIGNLVIGKTFEDMHDGMSPADYA